MKTKEEILKRMKAYEEHARCLKSSSRSPWHNKIRELEWVLDENQN